jgi:deoxyribonuclease V
MASGMGVALKLPTIGVSKNVLCGSFDPPRRVGEASPLAHQGERVGYVLLSKKGCRPMVVAPGHRVSVESALDLATRYLRDQKRPLPCRAAHRQAKAGQRRMLRGDISVSSGTRIFTKNDLLFGEAPSTSRILRLRSTPGCSLQPPSTPPPGGRV